MLGCRSVYLYISHLRSIQTNPFALCRRPHLAAADFSRQDAQKSVLFKNKYCLYCIAKNGEFY